MVTKSFFSLLALSSVICWTDAACPTSSVAGVPGCWGTPGCAYVIANDLKNAAACKYDYCNCGGTNVPLLTSTVSGSAVKDCGYTTQPSANNCPTDGPAISNPSNGSPSSLVGASVVTSSSGSVVLSETFVPTTYSQYTSLTTTTTLTTSNALAKSTAIVIGPGGIAWAPASAASSVPQLAAPTVLPVVSAGSQSQAGPHNSASSLSSHASAVPPPASSSASTLHSGSATSSSPETISANSASPHSGSSTSNAAPGPISASTSSISQSSDLTAFASNAPQATTLTASGVTEIWTRSTFSDLTSITTPITTTKPVVVTATNGQVQTTSAAIIIGPGGVWWSYSGGGGGGGGGGFCVWPFCHNGGGGGGGGGGSCVWPFCDNGGGGGGGNNDPTSPTNKNDPTNTNKNDPTNTNKNDPTNTNKNDPTTTNKNDPTTNKNDPTTTNKNDPTTTNKNDPTTTTKDDKSASSTSKSSSGSSSSCSASRTVSDCSVACSMPTSASTLSCATKCYSTISGCDVTGTTTTSTASACTKITGWDSVSDGPWIITDVTGSSTLPPITTPSASASGLTTSVRTSITSAASTETPQCMADGAPWFNPTSWCDCGTGVHYPTLAPTSGQTKANCAYTSLPASTINPTSTSAAPTNIPGVGGVDQCLPVESFAGTAAYCNCAGTPAPTLNPTSSGIMNCAYTLLPTSSYNPPVSHSSHSTWTAPTTLTSVVPSPSTTQQPPAFATGWCGFHVIEGHGSSDSDPPVALQVIVKDANGNTLQDTGAKAWDWNKRFEVDSPLPNPLYVTPKLPSDSRRSIFRKRTLVDSGADDQHKPTYHSSTLDFSYDTDSWTQADSSHCSVGAWDDGNFDDFINSLFGADFVATRQMDCGFTCASTTKRSLVEDAEIYDHNSTVVAEPSEDRTSHSVQEVRPSYGNHSGIEKRAIPRSPEFQAAAKKGQQLWQTWQAKPVTDADKDLLCDLEQKYALLDHKVSTGHPAGDLKSLLTADGKDINSPYYSIILQGPPPPDPKDFTQSAAQYSNAISPEAGIFLAQFNSRGDPKQTEDSSAILWWQWVKTVLKANAQATDFSGLTSFWRCSIINSGTTAILGEATLNKGDYVQKPLTFTPDDSDLNNNAFWAVLGTDNGKGIMYLLTDYKKSLKGKGIKSIKIQAYQDKSWFFWADIA